jgi:hypothetical protein
MVSAEHRVRIQSEVECRVIELAIKYCQVKATWRDYVKSLDHWLGYYLDVHSRELPRMPSWQLPKVTPIMIQFKP